MSKGPIRIAKERGGIPVIQTTDKQGVLININASTAEDIEAWPKINRPERTPAPVILRTSRVG